MALFSATLDAQPHGRSVSGDRYVRRGVANLGVYPTGGAVITKADFDLPVSLDHLEPGNAAGYVLAWDKTNSKILAYRQTAATSALIEVPNGTDITASTFRFRAEGK